MSIDYADSILVAKDGTVKSKQELAPLLPVGKRFFSAQVVNIASATADQLTTRMPTNGAFRLLVFPGNVAQPAAMDRLKKLATYLDGPESIVSKYTPATADRASVVDVITIRAFPPRSSRAHLTLLLLIDSSPRLDLGLYDFPQPSIFPPHNYKKIYADGPSCASIAGMSLPQPH